MHSDDVEAVQSIFYEMVDIKSPVTAVHRYVHALGHCRYVETHVTPVLESNGEIVNIVFVGRDITEKIEAEKAMKESWERYTHLQTSLDLFSKDLFGVMKVTELEKRLVKEVKDVLKVHSACIVEVDRSLRVQKKSSEFDDNLLRKVMFYYDRALPMCEVIETPMGWLIKIGKAGGKDYLLIIGGRTTLLLPEKVWLKTITRYVNVLYDNFRVNEDLTDELKKMASKQAAPPWLLRLLFNLTENERKRLSQDLHDSALQEQIIWYRKLEALLTDRKVSGRIHRELLTISEGLLDVIYQIRLTCNELRPPMLKEFGLVASLFSLFETTQLRADYEIVFDSTQFNASLNDELLIGLYRIVQELLANAAKHANADTVYLTLTNSSDQVELTYWDNGTGFRNNPEDKIGGMGVYGMKERVRSLEGRIKFESLTDQGLRVFITIPVHVHESDRKKQL